MNKTVQTWPGVATERVIVSAHLRFLGPLVKGELVGLSLLRIRGKIHIVILGYSFYGCAYAP
jgi:hypothetical protein